MQNIADSINLDFRKSDLIGQEVLLVVDNVLILLDRYGLPQPNLIDTWDNKKVAINGYLDPVVKALTEAEFLEKKNPYVLRTSQSKFFVTIRPSNTAFVLSICIPDDLMQLAWNEIRELFTELCREIKPEVGTCSASTATWNIRSKYFEWESRTTHFTFFSWLNYFNPKEFTRQGGDAIFQNPYIKAEQLGEGVLIQVGENPLDAHTPEGEELIVKATRALPPVVKD